MRVRWRVVAKLLIVDRMFKRDHQNKVFCIYFLVCVSLDSFTHLMLLRGKTIMWFPLYGLHSFWAAQEVMCHPSQTDIHLVMILWGLQTQKHFQKKAPVISELIACMNHSSQRGHFQNKHKLQKLWGEIFRPLAIFQYPVDSYWNNYISLIKFTEQW